ncbi:hypothetical protein [Bacillus benzoevorans]|uniref:Uncharacterized protein n=1 Tax=Bacillus benzoevorans TaxID=1456 RepID=A0A7X0HUZ3_9BACI|nr:hypothetical protein [Bacillus benzoevorans]MBB6447379.1 hypothetical protein [Bacillus benzoevorans]
MLKYKKEKKLGIERSDSPYRVDQNGLAHEVGKIRGIEIELSEEGYTKDLEELASMTFAELSQYLGFPR